LSSRGTEDAAEQQKRLETAVIELAAANGFDHTVVNDEVAKCAAQVVELMS
jgi:guanylate kinase